MQPVSDIETFFTDPDPWGFETNEDDASRRTIIKNACAFYNPKTILEIGAAEGFITKALLEVCDYVAAIELSKTAAARIPPEAKVVDSPGHWHYDLALAAGVFYGHYDWMQMREWVLEATPDVIITSHYDLVGVAHDDFSEVKDLVQEIPFKYREGYQTLKVWK